uniref:Uncharacterized protein n=1 Tax=Anguilla anguilla TaxID=7936 RepID=A0A0E9TNV0_ANGAN
MLNFMWLFYISTSDLLKSCRSGMLSVSVLHLG